MNMMHLFPHRFGMKPSFVIFEYTPRATAKDCTDEWRCDESHSSMNVLTHRPHRLCKVWKGICLSTVRSLQLIKRRGNGGVAWSLWPEANGALSRVGAWCYMVKSAYLIAQPQRRRKERRCKFVVRNVEVRSSRGLITSIPFSRCHFSITSFSRVTSSATFCLVFRRNRHRHERRCV